MLMEDSPRTLGVAAYDLVIVMPIRLMKLSLSDIDSHKVWMNIVYRAYFLGSASLNCSERPF